MLASLAQTLEAMLDNLDVEEPALADANAVAIVLEEMVTSLGGQR